MNITVILLYLVSFAIIWQFVGYPSLMTVVAIRARPKEKDFIGNSEIYNVAL